MLRVYFVQKLSRTRFLARKTQRKTREHGEECETSSTAHCGEVSDSEQCRSDGVESLSATSTVMVDKGTSCDIQLRDCSVNTHDCYESCQSLLATIAEQKEKINSLNDRVFLSSSPAAAMRNDNELLICCYSVLFVMMKLRLAVSFQDLSYRFCIGITVVSNIFHRWLDVMSRELKQLIVWPNRGILRETLLECFKPNYTRTICMHS